MTSQQQHGTNNLSNCVFLVFLVLKLCGTIDWSWWWVTAPLWSSAILVGAFAASERRTARGKNRP